MVQGSVLQSDARPAHPAVVIVVRTDGSAVDWSRGDSEGRYSVVLPAPGKYLVLANARGWAPRAEVLEFLDETANQHIILTDRLTLSGGLTHAGEPVPSALVTVSEAGGAYFTSVRADLNGRYCLPRHQWPVHRGNA